MSSRAPSTKIHRFSLAVSLTASLNGSSGLSAIAAQTKNQKSAVRRSRYLTRSQSDCGLRVGRSSSRGRLVNCGPETGAVEVISSLLHGPRVHDRVDRVLLVLIAAAAAAHHEQVQLLCVGVDDAYLVERHEPLAVREPDVEREPEPVESAVARELVEPQDLELVAIALLRDLVDRDHEVAHRDRKSTRLNSSHVAIAYAVFCLNKK